MSQIWTCQVSKYIIFVSRMNILFFAQSNYIVHIEQLLTPFVKIWGINNELATQVTIALLICTIG